MSEADDYYIMSTEYDPMIGYSDDSRFTESQYPVSLSDSETTVENFTTEIDHRLVISVPVAESLYRQLKKYDNTTRGGADVYRLKGGLVGLLYSDNDRRSEKVMISEFLNTEKRLVVETLYGKKIHIVVDDVSISAN